MTHGNVQSEKWGKFPKHMRDKIITAVVKSLPKYSKNPRKWKNFEDAIGHQLQKTTTIKRDVELRHLRVPGSFAEIDFCLEKKGYHGILIHLSGRTAARHEKELLEIISVTTANPEYKYGVPITGADNTLKSQGSHGSSSFKYCSDFLLKLIEPILKSSPIKGLLIIGYNAPN